MVSNPFLPSSHNPTKLYKYSKNNNNIILTNGHKIYRVISKDEAEILIIQNQRMVRTLFPLFFVVYISIWSQSIDLSAKPFSE